MIRNYLKVAWRRLQKNRISSSINGASLAIGMAVAILIGSWIEDELSYDKSFGNYWDIAQVMQHQHFNGDVQTDKAIPIPLAKKLRQDFGSDFTYIVLSSWTNPHVLSFEESNMSFTGNYMDVDAPEMLTLKMISGTRQGFHAPSSILISQTVSNTIFRNSDPVGKVIRLDGKDLKVAGVYTDFPKANSFRNVYFIAPWGLFSQNEDVKNAEQNWGANSYQLFAQVAPGENMQSVSSKIRNAKYQAIGEGADVSKPVIFLHPMSRWHLYSEFKNGINTGGAIQYVWMFGTIGIFVLLLACINFMNLSTAQSKKRAKEIGIRKVIGSRRRQLIVQFFSEALLITTLSFGMALVLASLALPYLNKIAGKEMNILWREPSFWILSTVLIIVTGVISGSYPAIFLSSFKPVRVLKGIFKAGKYATLPRKILVVAQFSISIILVIGTIVVFRQIQFGKNRDAGYDDKGLVIIRPYNDDFHKHLSALRNDLIQTALISDVAEGSYISKGSRTSGDLHWRGKNPATQDNLMIFGVSTEYGKAVGWNIVAGRDFKKNLATDSGGIILNEAAVSYMGFRKPIGEIINWEKQYTVIGVTKDIVMRSPFEPAVPTVYFIDNGPNFLNIKIGAGVGLHKALTVIEAACKKYSPSSPFEYKLADEEYDKKFEDEERVRSISVCFTIFAIMISCLGLFGLATFVAEQRTKEVGIRKIVGASAFNIWLILSVDFLILVMISVFIAIPFAWYATHSWLQNYAYRPALSWWIFAASSGGALLVTLMTVSFQSIRVVRMKPVKALKVE